MISTSAAGYPCQWALRREIGHVNVFESETLFDKQTGTRIMPYSRRAYYKISWLRGKSRAEYADKVIDIQANALLFATPRIPYHWVPADSDQLGMFCIFTPDFLLHSQSGVTLDDLPLFQPGQVPVFLLSDTEAAEIQYIFRKMLNELRGDYRYKYDLLRNLVLELIHYGRKLQPLSAMRTTQNASERISSLFLELLERQFPIDALHRRLNLRTPKDYADRLAVHVNHHIGGPTQPGAKGHDGPHHNRTHSSARGAGSQNPASPNRLAGG